MVKGKYNQRLDKLYNLLIQLNYTIIILFYNDSSADIVYSLNFHNVKNNLISRIITLDLIISDRIAKSIMIFHIISMLNLLNI